MTKFAKTDFNTLADMLLKFKESPEEIPRTKKRAVAWAQKQFPTASERGILIAMEKAGVTLRETSKSKSETQGLLRRQLKALQEENSNLRRHIKLVHTQIDLVQRQVEVCTGMEPGTLDTPEIVKCREMIRNELLNEEDGEDEGH